MTAITPAISAAHRAGRGRRLGWLALLCCLPLAADPPSPAGGDAAERAQLERLRALGYLSYTESRADPSQRGVLGLDRRRSHPGYQLATGTIGDELALLSATGRTVHRWRVPEDEVWLRAELLEEGDLLVLGGRRGAREEPKDEVDVLLDLPDEARFVIRMTWLGEVRWKRPMRAHHDLEPLPDGRIMILTGDRRRAPEIDPELMIVDQFVEVLSAAGDPLARWSIYEILRAGRFPFLRDAPPRDDRRPQRAIDLLHANNVEIVDLPQLAGRHAIYAPGNLLITLRHQDAVVVIDPAAGKLVWTWGPGELSGPHHGQMLANGNLLIFDNGLARRWSRVLELDPRSGWIVWQYRAPEPSELFTRTGGSCQRLANGNTLITSTNQGWTFEITPAGEVVWEYFNPHLGPRGRRGVIVRMKRYEAGFVQQLLRDARNARSASSRGGSDAD